jgi:hypothetical protein
MAPAPPPHLFAWNDSTSKSLWFSQHDSKDSKVSTTRNRSTTVSENTAHTEQLLWWRHLDQDHAQEQSTSANSFTYNISSHLLLRATADLEKAAWKWRSKSIRSTIRDRSRRLCYKKPRCSSVRTIVFGASKRLVNSQNQVSYLKLICVRLLTKDRQSCASQ